MEVYGTTVHLVNRTPHEVVVVRDDQEVLRLPKCDDPVRLHEQVLAAAGIHRKDLVTPDTGPTAIRNERGQVVAVRRLMRLASE